MRRGRGSTSAVVGVFPKHSGDTLLPRQGALRASSPLTLTTTPVSLSHWLIAESRILTATRDWTAYRLHACFAPRPGSRPPPSLGGFSKGGLGMLPATAVAPHAMVRTPTWNVLAAAVSFVSHAAPGLLLKQVAPKLCENDLENAGFVHPIAGHPRNMPLDVLRSGGLPRPPVDVRERRARGRCNRETLVGAP